MSAICASSPAAVRSRKRSPTSPSSRALRFEQCLRMPSRVSNIRFRPGKIGVLGLELVDDAQRLQVVLEAAVVAHAFVERVLAGMAERRVAEIVRQADRLGQRLVEAERQRHGAPICATSSECVRRVRYRSPS